MAGTWGMFSLDEQLQGGIPEAELEVPGEITCGQTAWKSRARARASVSKRVRSES